MFTQDEVAEHDGSNPSRPMYLSIQGVVYDITAGKAFYGPDGGALGVQEKRGCGCRAYHNAHDLP